jgi:hypothetical protein
MARWILAALLGAIAGRHSACAMASTPARVGESARALSGAPPIYCNRAVNLGRMEAVGFDMDHTLAQYKAEPFDQLAYRGALDKLVSLGYPAVVKVRAARARGAPRLASRSPARARRASPTAPPRFPSAARGGSARRTLSTTSRATSAGL